MNAPQVAPDSTTGAPLTLGAVAVDDASGGGERFVVGVDGSGQSVDPLRWAARIAAGTAAHIEVRTAWKPGMGMSGPFIARTDDPDIGPEDDAQALLSRVVHASYGSSRPPNVTLSARRGDAADILIEESKTAQLLVIGSRGLGEVAGLLLGSVSARWAEQAQCPVLIMHTPGQS